VVVNGALTLLKGVNDWLVKSRLLPPDCTLVYPLHKGCEFRVFRCLFTVPVPAAVMSLATPAASAPASQPPPAFYSPAEFAGATGLSLSTVLRYLAAGRLPKVQPGGAAMPCVDPH
jgi:hypothetical protein